MTQNMPPEGSDWTAPTPEEESDLRRWLRAEQERDRARAAIVDAYWKAQAEIFLAEAIAKERAAAAEAEAESAFDEADEIWILPPGECSDEQIRAVGKIIDAEGEKS